MKIAHTLTIPVTIALVALAAATSHATEGVSPGAVDRMAVVETRCPTFSWDGEAGAIMNEIVAYAIHENDDPAAAVLSAESEVLYSRVPGGATSWTPSADQCFVPGGRYVWFVRSVSELAGDQVVAAGGWSAGRYFTVPAAPSAEEMQRALDVLRRWDAANGGGEQSAFPAGARSGGASPTLRRSSWGGVLSGTDVDAGSAAPKSVPTASAAIRGEHPDTTGEKYGVVGTSASLDGAGLAAANTAGGPDLVLDGSANGEVDTQIYEWGLTRESADSETFVFRTTGGGVMMVEVEGILAADELSCPDCVTTAEIADGGVGTADLADSAITSIKIVDGQVRAADLGSDAVTTAKILDGTIAAADLADGSVTGAKIGAGAVDSGQIRGGAVENTHLADNAVTGGKIQDGAVRNADLASNAVTTDKIADGTIVAADLAAGAVGSAEIADGSVTGLDLGALTVNAGNLADWAVTTDKIDPGAVVGTKLADGAVTGSKIADGQVMSSKIANNAVNSTKVLDGTLTAADMDPAGGVYASKSAVYVVTEMATIPAWLCNNVTPDCNDANDLPLQGVWDVSSGATSFKKVSEEVVSWSSTANAAGYLVELCDTSGGDFDLTASIVCVSVPGP